MDVIMKAHNKNATTVSTERLAGQSAFKMNAKLELALGLWLSEMSGPSEELAHMAARMAQLDNRPQVLKRAA
jgi:hypothetical protein